MKVDDLIVELQMMKVKNRISGDSEVHFASEKRDYEVNGLMLFENTDKIYLTERRTE
jgi:hypothetical protein